mgnify:CR=1 FL=1
MSLDYRIYRGAEISAIVPDLARLRITVFRDWPYLYEGDLAYETGYLARYAQGGAIVVAAYDGAQMVGAATGMPLLQHDDDFSGALAACDIAAEDVFYCAESVLMQDHRGQGAGHMFFDTREAEARAHADADPFHATGLRSYTLSRWMLKLLRAMHASVVCCAPSRTMS